MCYWLISTSRNYFTIDYLELPVSMEITECGVTFIISEIIFKAQHSLDVFVCMHYKLVSNKVMWQMSDKFLLAQWPTLDWKQPVKCTEILQ